MCLQVERVVVEGEEGEDAAMDEAYTALGKCADWHNGTATGSDAVFELHAQQSWVFVADGTVRPASGTGAAVDASDYCLTASWSFVTATAFVVPPPQSGVVLVAMNEASTSAFFDVDVEGGAEGKPQALPSKLPPHSIRTYVFR
jgi:hypothetical protein